jgi:hypothetical protein
VQLVAEGDAPGRSILDRERHLSQDRSSILRSPPRRMRRGHRLVAIAMRAPRPSTLGKAPAVSANERALATRLLRSDKVRLVVFVPSQTSEFSYHACPRG